MRIDLRDLQFGYNGRPMLPPLSVCLGDASLTLVMGPNGAGKTTLLRTVLGLLPPVGGSATIGGRGVYVAQRSRVPTGFPGRVRDVVESGALGGWNFLRPGGRDARARQIDRAMDDAGVSHLAGEPFARLSEGQKQRALIARALVADPNVIVLDEPTSALDIGAEHRVMELLERVREQRKAAILIVSHHLPVVAEFATHAIVLDREAGLAIGGAREVIGVHAAVIARYGSLLSAPRCVAGPDDASRAHGHHGVGTPRAHGHGHDHHHHHHRDHEHDPAHPAPDGAGLVATRPGAEVRP